MSKKLTAGVIARRASKLCKYASILPAIGALLIGCATSPSNVDSGLKLSLFLEKQDANGYVRVNGYVGPPEAGVDRLVWNWGDGSPTIVSHFPADHHYRDYGNYIVTVTAVNIAGGAMKIERIAASYPEPVFVWDPLTDFFAEVRPNVQITKEEVIFIIETSIPFPNPERMSKSGLIKFIWFIDADRNTRTTQGGEMGNDYNLHLEMTPDVGWYSNVYTVSDLTNGDRIDTKRIIIEPSTYAVKMRVPRDLMLLDNFDWYLQYSIPPMKTERRNAE